MPFRKYWANFKCEPHEYVIHLDSLTLKEIKMKKYLDALYEGKMLRGHRAQLNKKDKKANMNPKTDIHTSHAQFSEPPTV